MPHRPGLLVLSGRVVGLPESVQDIRFVVRGTEFAQHRKCLVIAVDRVAQVARAVRDVSQAVQGERLGLAMRFAAADRQGGFAVLTCGLIVAEARVIPADVTLRARRVQTVEASDARSSVNISLGFFQPWSVWGGG